MAIYLSHEGHNFCGNQATVTIRSLDAAQVKGTFSGTFTAKGKTVTIQDGSFDLTPVPKNKPGVPGKLARSISRQDFFY